jgi:hypothetical protein
MKMRDEAKADEAGAAARREGEKPGGEGRGLAVEEAHREKSSLAAEANTAASAGRSDFASRVVRAELQTGAVLLVLENRATPTVSLRASLRAGSYFEPPDRPGLARLTAEMLERGTRRRSKFEIAEALESVGAELEFSADPFAVGVAGRCLSSRRSPRCCASRRSPRRSWRS